MAVEVHQKDASAIDDMWSVVSRKVPQRGLGQAIDHQEGASWRLSAPSVRMTYAPSGRQGDGPLGSHDCPPIMPACLPRHLRLETHQVGTQHTYDRAPASPLFVTFLTVTGPLTSLASSPPTSSDPQLVVEFRHWMHTHRVTMAAALDGVATSRRFSGGAQHGIDPRRTLGSLRRDRFYDQKLRPLTYPF